MNLKSLFIPNPRFVNNPLYRADIDGLRAFAVISVILFHLDIPWVSGGYVGVDIFFVISGYLITQLIQREQQTGSFSLANFYERRVRRIFPSLLAVLALSGVAATLMFSPADLIAFSSALIASLLFVANIVFYNQINYFNTEVENKPLLHLWSLSVEEQFYLIWPLLVVAVLRYAPRRMGLTLATIFSASLVVSILLTRHDAQAAFYLLPSRIFEFLIGAALVWLPCVSTKNRGALDILLLAGIGMMIGSVLLFTKQTPFPSYTALLPCIGAACIIYSGGFEPSLQRFMGQPILAYIGRISYQLYLFHWPVIIFYRYLGFDATDEGSIITMVVITTVLSVATYHTIDFPIRTGFKKTLRQRHDLLIACVAVSVMLMAVAMSMKMQNGWWWRLPKEAQLFTHDPLKFHEANYGGAGLKDNTLLTLGDASAAPSFIIFGDSFAAQYGLALSDMLRAKGRSAYAFFHTGCMMLPGVVSNARVELREECYNAFAQVTAALQNSRLPILHAQSWSTYKDNLLNPDHSPIHFAKDDNTGYYQFIIAGIDRVRQTFPNNRLIIVGIPPGIQEQKSLARCFRIPTYLPNKCSQSVAFKEETQINGQQFNIAAAQYVAEHPEVTFMNPRDALCREGLCYAIDGSNSIYSDYSHFTKYGAAYVLNHFSGLIHSLQP